MSLRSRAHPWWGTASFDRQCEEYNEEQNRIEGQCYVFFYNPKAISRLEFYDELEQTRRGEKPSDG